MKPPPAAGELETFMAALEDNLRNGQDPGVAFANASTAFERVHGQPCPFTCVRSCPSCKHYDRGHCHRWGKNVPQQYVDAGCSEHAYVTPAPADPSLPF